jgi:hypothetical protein
MGVTEAASGRMIGELPLTDGGGEPVNLARTLASHGVATLPPQLVDQAAGTLETTLRMQHRTCVECGRTYMPSSRHLRCPACRSKDSCSCGSSKQGKSATCSACRTVAGESNGNWKGGQTRHKAGYIIARAPGHPRAAGSSSYVFEHILVMEEILGRFLLPGESVHHLNGIRDDNRPEILELWTRPQPTGIRASDAVAWARHILELYGGLDTSNNAQGLH